MTVEYESKEPWKFDKRVPLALIFAIVLQGAIGLTWANQLSFDVARLKSDIKELRNEAKETRKLSNEIAGLKSDLRHISSALKDLKEYLKKRR